MGLMGWCDYCGKYHNRTKRCKKESSAASAGSPIKYEDSDDEFCAKSGTCTDFDNGQCHIINWGGSGCFQRI